MRQVNRLVGNDRVKRLNSLVVRTDGEARLCSSCSLYRIMDRFVINRVYWWLIAGTANPYSTYHRYDVCIVPGHLESLWIHNRMWLTEQQGNQGSLLFHVHLSDHYSYCWIFKMLQFSAISCGILTCNAASLVFTYVRFHFRCFTRKHLKATWLKLKFVFCFT